MAPRIQVVSVGIQGPVGASGPAGAAGAPGVGLSSGGTTGQALIKNSNTNYDTSWATVVSTPGGSNTQVQFNSSGAFGGSTSFTWDGTQLAVIKQTITAPSAGVIPLLLKGAVSHTANYLELQTNAGGFLAAFNKDGNLFLGGNTYDYLSSPGGGGSFGWTTPFAGTVSFKQGQSGQQIAFRCVTAENKIASFTHYDVANVKGRLFEISTDAAVFLSFAPSNLEMLRMNGFATADATSLANWVITSPYAAKQVLILKAPASYTANFLECQDNGGAILLRIKSTGVLNLPAYTVSTLPTGAQGDRCYVTDALTPTFLTALTGGGAVRCPAFHNGTSWVAG
jgi:hypothetical protein